MSSVFKFIAFLLLISAFAVAVVQSKSFCAIGNRIYGDQLLVKDVLQARSAGVDENAKIRYNYEVPEPITYIEITSEENVNADVKFSYHDNLIEGTVTAINASGVNSIDEIDIITTAANTVSTTSFAPAVFVANFKVEIKIFGFNKTMLNLSPSLVLNRNREYESMLEPEYYEEAAETNEFDSAESDKQFIRFDTLNTEDETNDDNDDDNDTANNDNDSHHDYADADEDLDDSDADITPNDKIIELGKRQKDDHLIYDNFQVSSTSSDEPTNHSVVFYYVDSDYITYVKFVVFDHVVDRTATDYSPPVAEYTHFSPTTLKAVITDYRATSLFVRMYMYGYKPAELPVDYVSFLTSSLGVGAGIDTATDTPTLLSRLRSKAELQSRLNKEMAKLQEVDNNADDDNNDENVAETSNENAENGSKSMLSCLEQTISGSDNTMSKGLSIASVLASTSFFIGFSAALIQ